MAEINLVGTIVKPTSKGQMTIPADIRRELAIDQKTFLNITKKGEGFLVVPLRKILVNNQTKVRERKILTPSRRKRLLKMLKGIQGLWSDMEETTEEFMNRVRYNKYEKERVKKARKTTF